MNGCCMWQMKSRDGLFCRGEPCVEGRFVIRGGNR